MKRSRRPLLADPVAPHRDDSLPSVETLPLTEATSIWVAGPLVRIARSPLVRSTATYLAADAANKAIPFVLLPLIARYLSTADYGLLTNFSVLSQILIAFCALNTYSALNVSYFKLERSSRLSGYLSNLVYLIATLTGLCMIIMLALAPAIHRYFGLTRTWQLAALATAFSAAVYTLYASLLRMQLKAIRFGAFQLSQSFLSAALAILFVVGMKWNWQGRVLSIVLPAVAAMVFSIWSLEKGGHLFKRVSAAEMKDALVFGVPLLPHTLSFWLKSGMVKLIITDCIGLSANGVYSIALTLGSIVGVFTDSFFSAYSPSIFKDLTTLDAVSEDDAESIKARLVRNTYRFAAALFVVCLVGWLIMATAIPFLFTGGYLAASQLIPLVFVALYFDGMYSIVSGYVFYRRKTKVLGTITFLSSLVQVALALLLVPTLGIRGALYAGCIVSLLTFIAVLSYANRLYDLPWRTREGAS